MCERSWVTLFQRLTVFRVHLLNLEVYKCPICFMSHVCLMFVFRKLLIKGLCTINDVSQKSYKLSPPPPPPKKNSDNNNSNGLWNPNWSFLAFLPASQPCQSWNLKRIILVECWKLSREIHGRKQIHSP